MAKETRTTGATASGRRTVAVSPAPKAKAAPARPAAKAAAAAKRVVKPAGKSKASHATKAPAKGAAKATKSVKKAAKAAPKPAKKAAPAKATAKKAVTKAPAKKAPPAKAVAKKAPVKAPAKAAAKKAPAKAPAKATKAPAVKAAPAKKTAKILKPALAPKPAPSRPVLSEVVARKHRTPAVAASTMERLRAQLLEELGHHRRQAEGLQAEAEALANEREPGDTQFDEESGEGDTLSVERERDLALSTAARQTVEEIEKSLARMDDGTYGYCEVCGDRIPVPRLEAIPWADQCVKCKSRGERRR
jgi:RNA polymerase-binding protein DksA